MQETGKRHKVLKLPPTTTGLQVVAVGIAHAHNKHGSKPQHHLVHLLQGIISVKTLTELERMRRGGVKLVLITGARLSTMLTRMAFLPAADAYVCENGGRIYYPDATLTVALPIAEDMEWRRTHNATGTNHGLQCHVALQVAVVAALHAIFPLTLLCNKQDHKHKQAKQRGLFVALFLHSKLVCCCTYLPVM